MRRKVGITTSVIKLVVCTAVSFIALMVFVFGGVVFGWFYDNRISAAGGMNATMRPDDLRVNYFVYAYDLFGDETVSDLYSINNLKMNPYDMIFVHRNDFTPVVVRIEISGDNSLSKSGAITVNILRDTLIDQTSPDYFSSVVKFSCVFGAEILGSTAAATFDNVANIIENGSPLGKDYFKTASLSSTVKAFFYESEGTYFKHDNVAFTVNYSESDFNGDTLNLYLYFDYDKTRIEEFILLNTGGGASFTENELSAENDLIEIYARILR